MKKLLILLLLLCPSFLFAQQQGISFKDIYTTLDDLEYQVKTLNSQSLTQSALIEQQREQLQEARTQLSEAKEQMTLSESRSQEALTQVEEQKRIYSSLERRYKVLKVVAVALPVASSILASVLVWRISR